MSTETPNYLQNARVAVATARRELSALTPPAVAKYEDTTEYFEQRWKITDLLIKVGSDLDMLQWTMRYHGKLLSSLGDGPDRLPK